MVATKQDIRNWLIKMYEDPNITHMIVKTDTFDWEDYPVYVMKGENVVSRAMDSKDNTTEVYSKNHDMEKQLAERRAFHYD